MELLFALKPHHPHSQPSGSRLVPQHWPRSKVLCVRYWQVMTGPRYCNVLSTLSLWPAFLHPLLPATVFVGCFGALPTSNAPLESLLKWKQGGTKTEEIWFSDDFPSTHPLFQLKKWATVQNSCLIPIPRPISKKYIRGARRTAPHPACWPCPQSHDSRHGIVAPLPKGELYLDIVNSESHYRKLDRVILSRVIYTENCFTQVKLRFKETPTLHLPLWTPKNKKKETLTLNNHISNTSFNAFHLTSLAKPIACSSVFNIYSTSTQLLPSWWPVLHWLVPRDSMITAAASWSQPTCETISVQREMTAEYGMLGLWIVKWQNANKNRTKKLHCAKFLVQLQRLE